MSNYLNDQAVDSAINEVTSTRKVKAKAPTQAFVFGIPEGLDRTIYDLFQKKNIDVATHTKYNMLDMGKSYLLVKGPGKFNRSEYQKALKLKDKYPKLVSKEESLDSALKKYTGKTLDSLQPTISTPDTSPAESLSIGDEVGLPWDIAFDSGLGYLRAEKGSNYIFDVEVKGKTKKVTVPKKDIVNKGGSWNHKKV